MTERQSAIIDGRRQSWFESGEGDALVFVHGIGSDARLWEPWLDGFAPRFRVLAWELPGYGASEPLAEEAPAVEAYAAALSAFLADRGVRRAHFVGHSVGAMIIAALLRDWPGEALSFTLLHPVAGAGRLDPEKRESIRRGRVADVERLGMAAFAAQRGREVLGPEVTEEAAARHLAIMTDVPDRAYLQAWEMMCRSDLFALLDSVRCPAQVIAGGADRVAPEPVCAEIAARLPKARLIRLDGVGHSAAVEAPDRLTAALSGLLDGH